MYSKYLILLDNNPNSKFTVINYFTNKIDTVFQNLISRREAISELYAKNDTLYAYEELIKAWIKWNNKWIKKKPFNNKFYKEFDKSYLKKWCQLIYEDDKYFVYSYFKGEFGTGVLFLNKKNGKISGHTMITATSVYKDNIGYVVSGNTYFLKKMSQLIRIKDPDKLPIVPENQIIYKKDTTKYDYKIQKNLSEYLNNQRIHKLSDSLQLKILTPEKK